MRRAAATYWSDLGFDLPPRFVVVERRMAGQALDRWNAAGGGPVAGFESNSLLIADPAELARIEQAGAAITATFGLAAGMALDGRDGLAAELRAACDLIAIDPRPVPFEASLSAPGRALVLVRGIALPVDGPGVDRVQIVMNWREVLNRTATARLRRDLGVALRLVPTISAKIDPFLPKRTS
ncbi:MAG: hypothetical protein ACOYLS_13315 [Polymorphobacter sp.]